MEIGFDCIFLTYVMKSHVIVFLLTINRSRPIGKRTNFVTHSLAYRVNQCKVTI